MNLPLKQENNSNVCEIIDYKIVPHLDHRLKIQKFLTKIIDILRTEIIEHDTDKLHYYIEGNNPRLKAQAIFLHKLKSSHHVGLNPRATPIDDLVMLCDWISYWDLTVPKVEIIKKFNHHCKKEDITPEIKQRLQNMLEKYFIGEKNERA